MSKVITCHRKDCRRRVPFIHAKNNDQNQWFCSAACRDWFDPPHEEPTSRPLAQTYWNILLRQKPKPVVEIPTMEFGDWT